MLYDDLIVGAKAIAAFTGLSERQIYHMTEDGRLPVIRKGRRLFARKSELEASFRSEVVA